ncbi:MAG: two-component sensor histidine kinase [Actinomycetia bacterium]|nr:two-component sensor histidine kinase [Actinomycetes bacterium]
MSPILSIVLLALVGAVALVLGIRLGRTGLSQPTAPTPESAPVPHLGPARPPQETVESGGLDKRTLTLLGALPGVVILVNAKGVVLQASDEATTLRLVRRGIITSVEVADTAAKCVASKRTSATEVSLVRPSKRRGNLDLRVRAIYLPGGYAALLLDDLTEENRLTAIRRDFVANVGHELKTPVGAISLLAEALEAASDDPESVQHFANRMKLEAERLASLINDVIDLSRLQGEDPLSDPETIDLNVVLESAIDTISSAAHAKRITIVTSCEGDHFIEGDADQVSTALINLLNNAVAYSEPNTRVAVAVRVSDEMINVDVKDQGIGIPEAELSRIFERFYRVDSARSRVTGGTGLGLAIVRNVCSNHGGDIFVWSVEGEGSTFTMSLPRIVAARPDADSAEAGLVDATPREVDRGT